MVLENGFKHTYSGTTALYDYASRSNDIKKQDLPRFLRRNITKILDSHERTLSVTGLGRREESVRARIVPPGIVCNRTESPDHKTLDWYPSEDEIRACETAPMLRIVPHAIVSRDSSRPDTSKRVSEPDWLPDPDSFNLTSELQCTIQRRPDLQSSYWKATYQETKAARLLCAVQNDGKSSVTIRLDAPFIFPLAVMLGSEDTQQPNLESLPDNVNMGNYRLKMEIAAGNAKARRELYDFLHEGDPKNEAFDIQAPIRAFVAGKTLAGGFATTEEEQFVQLNIGKISDSHPTKYRLAVNVHWNKGGESILESSRRSRLSMSASKLAEEVVPKQKSQQDEWEITYMAGGSLGRKRIVVANNLKCQFCRDKLPHSSFDRLHMHYIVNHEHFVFTLKATREFQGVQQRTLFVELNAEPPRPRASNGVPDEREMEWIRPSKPFHLQKYLRGDDSWVSPRGLPRKARQKSPVRETSSNAFRSSAPSRERSPTGIQTLQPRKRKRYQVPLVPNVELYRTATKRELKAGEVLSESDEDSEDDWAAEKQKLRQSPIRGASRGEFFRMFNRYIHEEGPCSDKHLQYAVIRFAKSYRKQLQRPLVFKDWKTKLQQLLLTGLIPRRTHDYCVSICMQSDEDFNAGVSPGLRNGTNGIKHNMSNGVEHSDEDSGPLGNGMDIDKDPDKSADAKVARRLDTTIFQWQHLPSPEKAPGAHPLTGHPKVKQLLGFVAIHPAFQTRLFDILCSKEAQAAAILKLESIVHGRTPLRVYQDDYEKWLLALTDAESVTIHAGTCCCGGVPRGVEAITCGNTYCRSSGFHRVCVNVTDRVMDWKCMACDGRSTPWVLTKLDLLERERQEKIEVPTLQNREFWVDMLGRQATASGESKMLE
ncbi:hypothetical protein CAC42_7961 [Sphaceloma murrayae]|uniref:Polycomb protein VEFS-Box domain-containing protein n=1 Tax=Sphaceloma murrayae TaxID=2082308 RepID=A0A2K1QY57_9PEZI|nr:hypothetical protein CAC42_7961 [Sphaceloma murrayae]